MRIALPRGDIRQVRFLISNPDKTITDIDFTEIYFTVKKTAHDPTYLFQKKLTTGGIIKLQDGDYQVKIEPEDTSNMGFGQYKFDVKLIYLNQLKETFVGDFVLTEEITNTPNTLNDNDIIGYDNHSVVQHNTFRFTIMTPVAIPNPGNYEELINKPTINGVELYGNMVFSDLGLPDPEQVASAPLSDSDIDDIISGLG